MFLEAKQSPQFINNIEIPKTKAIVERLRKNYDKQYGGEKILSPTAINAYINCKFSFYLRYVAGLKAPDEVSEDIDSQIFGNIFHKVAQTIYDDLMQRDKLITKDRLDALLKDDIKLRNYVDMAFKKEFFKISPTEKTEYNGLQLINFEVILRYIKQLLRLDAAYCPFTYVESEKKVEKNYVVKLNEKNEITIHLGGYIDRIDYKDGKFRIIDYKTGSHDANCDSIGSVFEENRKDGSNYILQTFLYADMYSEIKKEPIQPALLYIRKASNDDYTPIVSIAKNKVEDYHEYEQDFQDNLIALLKEMFTEGGVYNQSIDEKGCSYCDFKAICKIKAKKK